MFQIQSERLGLWPLSQHQLILLSNGRNELEKALGLVPSNFEINADKSFMNEFSEALSSFVVPAVESNPDNFQWFTHWLIIDLRQNITVGGIGGTGLPDVNGQVMIGYFIDQKFEGRGFATEAVSLLTRWMFLHPSLSCVIADTPIDNYGSQKVLQKSGFKRSGEVEEGIRWQLSKDT